MPKKRANGEGSLRKRKDGRWEGRYTAGCDPTTGKPIHKSVLAKTQSEAKEKLKQAIAEAEKLDMSRAKSYTLGAWIKLWYEVYAEPRLREKTKDYYLNYIDNHIIPELGNTPLEKLTTIQIQKFYNDLQKSGRIQRYTHIKLKDKGLSTRVVRGIHTLLNNCLEQAVAERLLLANPAKGCRLPKLEKREMKILPEAAAYHPAVFYFCSAFGKNNGSPYSFTPYSPISVWISGEQIHLINVFAASLLTSGYFSGFTAITPYWFKSSLLPSHTISISGKSAFLASQVPRSDRQ